ncbi:nucleotidyltransferase family protein [Maridesulfovibrio sp.]|uniref:nucleotidyltransferase family protein n=1 Tax=Maridesulfovibrio sp. TaxID=2795000 RepID=UPI0039EF4144
MKIELSRLIVAPDTSIQDCLGKINEGSLGIIMVCSEDYILEGVITDGDIRRAFLEGKSLDAPCIDIAGKSPLTASPGVTTQEALDIMDHGKEHTVHHLPIVDDDGKIVDLLLRRDLCDVSSCSPELRAVVMAGGFGTRLRPLTEAMPKPMLPVGDRPLLERIIDQLKQAEIRHINITTHFMPEKIVEHFGNGENFGVDINYVSEDKPLGTAGALSLIDKPDTPLLVINGDILTQVDFSAMLAFHKEQKAALTVGVRQYEFQIPYGVVECDGPNVCKLSEKPTKTFLVNAGIYLLEPEVQQMVPSGKFTDMTDLIECLLKQGQTVTSFPVMEYWLDIGQIADYEKAQSDIAAFGINGSMRYSKKESNS